MKKILLCTLLTLLAALSYGQGKDSLGFFRRIDRKIYEKKLAKVDPEYISIPETVCCFPPNSLSLFLTYVNI